MFFYLIHTTRRSPSLPAPRAAIRRPRVLDRVPTVQLPLGPTLFERNFEDKVLITLSTPSTIRGELAAGGATLAIHGTTEVFRILVSDNVKYWYPTNIATPPSQKWPSQNPIQAETGSVFRIELSIAIVLDSVQRLAESASRWLVRVVHSLPTFLLTSCTSDDFQRKKTPPSASRQSSCSNPQEGSPHSFTVLTLWRMAFLSLAPTRDVFWPRCSRNQLNRPASDEGAAISILVRNLRKSGVKMIPDFIDVVE
ncbi:hypothetical protein EDB92DRAFT_554261 [Lactarius akahatsu]|uniref:Uncharacterized protein n=1 Tax=Lactarius akahatsu TaxID=416441 RepID=A0AAD4L3U3_9AGAM|nr:hypothetical protein EDB92DRAFT_554261 [Lactarius akahatsu]